MKILKIKLKNFKNFSTEKEFYFGKLNFIKGNNGTGKTTLALESILFCLYGYTFKNSLAGLPTREKSKSCNVEITVKDKNNKYIIFRSYPTKIKIQKDNEELKFSNNLEAQRFIDKLFGNRINFIKFRTIDAYRKESNFLEEGNTAFKRILFSSSDEIFSKIKDKLNNLKHEREIFNKETASVNNHYPSLKRLSVLNNNINKLDKNIKNTQREIKFINKDYIKNERQKSKLAERKQRYASQQTRLKQTKKCYTCGQELSKEKQKKILENLKKEINILESTMPKVNNQLDITKTMLKELEIELNSQRNKKDIINNLKYKLQERIKQKDYKWTNKDVLVVKKAIKEIDNLSTYYLTESIKILKPIINSVLEKINFKVNFEINDKGKFIITLKKDNIKYNYKDLSTGQKLILQIAFKLALLIEKNESGIIIADEGLSSLDEINLLHIIHIFENYPFQLFLVLHNAPVMPESIKIINLEEK